MAFQDRDTTAQVANTRSAEVTEVTFRRRDDLEPGAAPLSVIVTRTVQTNGEKHVQSARVPQSMVDSIWPGTAKTLKAWLLLAIDNADWG